jgi:uncharacterized protein involved in type VI secretion and phage assembly
LLDLKEKDADGSGKIEGIAIGIVANNKDPEGLGRVKIKFPWQDENTETSWARMSTLMGGKDRGSFFLPEVGDEVVVAFDHGDINHPYVIGALWNRNDKPPESNKDGKNNIKIIRSRCGHELILDDSSQKERIEIHSKSGQVILLDGSMKEEKLEVRSASGHSIILEDTPGKEKVKIMDKSGNYILLDSLQNLVEISSKLKVRIKASIIEIESGGMMKIKSDGIMDIKGSLVKIN